MPEHMLPSRRFPEFPAIQSPAANRPMWRTAITISIVSAFFLFCFIIANSNGATSAPATPPATRTPSARIVPGPAPEKSRFTAPPGRAMGSTMDYARKLAERDGNRYGRDLYDEFTELMEISRRLFPNEADRQIYDAVIMVREAALTMDRNVGHLICHQMLHEYADGKASSYEIAMAIIASEAAAEGRNRAAREYLSGAKPLDSWAYSDTCIFCGARADRTYPICRTHAEEYRMSPNGYVESLKDDLNLQLTWNEAQQVYDIFVVQGDR